LKSSAFWLTFIVVAAFGSIDCNMRHASVLISSPPPFLEEESPWADSVLSGMSSRERIGQLFMVAAYSNKDKVHEDEILELVTKHHIGGLIFFQGGPSRQAKLTNMYQDSARVPLWIGMDAEWGLGMRLDSTISFPRQMTLGAIQDPQLIYRFGKEMANQLKRMQVDVSFSPVVDINSNPANPVIGNRSFGEERKRVAELGVAYMRGLQDNGVLANAKHFPGHGDTDADSHHSLPVINHDYNRLDSLELAPFRKLIQSGVGSIMVAHLEIPTLDTTKNRASTLSPNIVQGLLRDSLGFRGLVFTDALNMKGVASFYQPGEVDLMALQAGNDVLLFPEDVPAAIAAIENALISGTITQAEIDRHCLKILRAKEWLGINNRQKIELANLNEDLNNASAIMLKEDLIEASLTILKNEELIPFTYRRPKQQAVMNIGTAGESFNEVFSRYFDFDAFTISHDEKNETYTALLDSLAGYSEVVVNLLNTSNRPSKNYGITEKTDRFILELSAKTKVLLNVYASPYALSKMVSPTAVQGLVISYQDDDLTQKVTAEMLAGACTATGKLSVSASADFPLGSGLPITQPSRIRFSSAERTGISPSAFSKIDEIVKEGIAAQAFPGCEVLVLKDWQVVYNKSFGHFTYEEQQEVTNNTIYDLASITKIASSTAALMQLQDQGIVDVDGRLCDYLDICDTSSYHSLNLRDILSHYARLQAWVPFYDETLDKGAWKTGIYSKYPAPGFSVQVADSMYIADSYSAGLQDRILQTGLRSAKEYKYSDLGYYFIKDIIESKTKMSLDRFTDSTLYSPLGLKTMGYLPLSKFTRDAIAPTEYDLRYRMQLVQGHVHDQGAAMLGGVGGHAGLFSNAQDLAVLMQMFMNDGYYGGKQYISGETLNYFTSCHYCDEGVRRGIGFDKPTRELNNGPSCNSASSNSFGHTGFTGTICWADPDHDIVYVFLSNRVYPNAENKKLVEMDIRTRIHQVIYDAYGIPARTTPGQKTITGRN
jgi:beta-glucosidase-like glycosyl hydrolase/CubicO group peptidase (beta-lactamase class C family)